MADPDRRLHVGETVAGATASLIVSWPETATIDDIEDAIKAAARSGVRAARLRTQAHQ